MEMLKGKLKPNPNAKLDLILLAQDLETTMSIFTLLHHKIQQEVLKWMKTNHSKTPPLIKFDLLPSEKMSSQLPRDKGSKRRTTLLTKYKDTPHSKSQSKPNQVLIRVKQQQFDLISLFKICSDPD